MVEPVRITLAHHLALGLALGRHAERNSVYG
jgi:hypothetical protein